MIRFRSERQGNKRPALPRVAVIAEKPSLGKTVATSIQKYFSDMPRSNLVPKKEVIGEYDSVLKKRLPSKYVYQFVAPTPPAIRQIEPSAFCEFKVMSTLGNVTRYDIADSRFKNRKTGGDGELFNARIGKFEIRNKNDVLKFLLHETDSCDYIILWLDCDKAGENICFQLIEALGWHHLQDRIFRAKFSGVSDEDVVTALQTLGRPDETLSLQIDAQQLLDFKIGCQFARYFDQHGFGSFSYGPCMTPTLGLVIARHNEIQEFDSKLVYRLKITLRKPGKKHGEFEELKLTKDVENKQEADEMVERVMGYKGKKIKVVNVVEKVEPQKRPSALNTYEFMRKASSDLRISPAKSMDYAEKLYTTGVISYPRTETTVYDPKEIAQKVDRLLDNIEAAQDYFKKDQNWIREIENAVMHNEGIPAPTESDKIGCIPPITPTSFSVDYRDLKLDVPERQCYEMICTHFFASVSRDCEYHVTEVVFEIGKDQFVISRNKVLTKGFTALLPSFAIKEENLDLSSLRVGDDSYEVMDVDVSKEMSSPPKYLTEAELITIMEKERIGTNGSISKHIDALTQRAYVEVDESTRRLKPTKLGLALAQLFEPKLLCPKYRAMVEKELNTIDSTGKFDTVTNHYIREYKKKFDDFGKEFQKKANALKKQYDKDGLKYNDTEKKYNANKNSAQGQAQAGRGFNGCGQQEQAGFERAEGNSVRKRIASGMDSGIGLSASSPANFGLGGVGRGRRITSTGIPISAFATD